MTSSELFEDIDAELNHFEQLYPSLNDGRIDQYYDCEKFNDTFTGDSVNDFSVLHVNIRSLNANGESLVVHLSLFNCEFDVACLTETWVDEPGLFDIILDNHSSIHSPRFSIRGGDTAIHIKKSF